MGPFFRDSGVGLDGGPLDPIKYGKFGYLFWSYNIVYRQYKGFGL